MRQVEHYSQSVHQWSAVEVQPSKRVLERAWILSEATKKEKKVYIGGGYEFALNQLTALWGLVTIP